MGKDNGIIRDGVKGGNTARVQNGAVQVRVIGGGGGGTPFSIDALPAAGPLAYSDAFPVSQSGIQGKSTLGALTTLALGTATHVDSVLFNAAIGTNALASNTTGNNNFAAGYIALNANTTGSNNTAVGSNALPINTTGVNNTAIGSQTLQNNTTGNQNIAVGQAALFTNTSGIRNIGIGIFCLFSNTTGSNNTAIGRLAMRNNLTGVQNVCIGEEAGFNCVSNSNVAVGFLSLHENTGNANVAIGHTSLNANTSGTLNTAIGYVSGWGDGTADRKTTVDTKMTFLGALASRDASVPTATPLTQSCAIGYNATVATSNTIVLGTVTETVSVPGQIKFNSSTGGGLLGPYGPSSAYNAIGLGGDLSINGYNFAGAAGDGNLYINRATGKNIIFRENGATPDQIVILPGGVIYVGYLTTASIVYTDPTNKLTSVGPAISVTGSRVANPALASLLTVLATLGLITDNTTI